VCLTCLTMFLGRAARRVASDDDDDDEDSPKPKPKKGDKKGDKTSSRDPKGRGKRFDDGSEDGSDGRTTVALWLELWGGGGLWHQGGGSTARLGTNASLPPMCLMRGLLWPVDLDKPSSGGRVKPGGGRAASRGVRFMDDSDSGDGGKVRKRTPLS
jgi:hypothetical protein